jgi:hypothetical protein
MEKVPRGMGGEKRMKRGSDEEGGWGETARSAHS